MLEIVDCAQNSEEWARARLGIPTASQFATILASGRGGGESKTRKTYLYKLAGEILTGVPAENYQSADMVRGHEMEPEARADYAFVTGHDPVLVGFLRNHGAGASPDALIGADGLLEIKTKAPHVLIDAMDRGEFPPEHKAQCQGALWIAEREWIDLACFWPGLPLFVRRATRDEAFIANLAGEVKRFNAELQQVVEFVRRQGWKAAA